MLRGRFMRLVSIEFPVYEESENYGRRLVRWDRLATFDAEWQDALPSRSEAVRSGLAQSRNQTRLRMRYRPDIDSAMRVILHGGDQDVVYQIVGGPAAIGGRQRYLEMVLERYSTTGGAT